MHVLGQLADATGRPAICAVRHRCLMLVLILISTFVCSYCISLIQEMLLDCEHLIEDEGSVIWFPAAAAQQILSQLFTTVDADQLAVLTPKLAITAHPLRTELYVLNVFLYFFTTQAHCGCLLKAVDGCTQMRLSLEEQKGRRRALRRL